MYTVVTTLIYKTPVDDPFDYGKMKTQVATGIFGSDDLINCCTMSLHEAISSAEKRIQRSGKSFSGKSFDDMQIISHSQVIIEGEKVKKDDEN